MIQTLDGVFTVLNGITGFENKVAYHAFPVKQVPTMPYITYREAYTHNFSASNKVACPIRHIAIELYTQNKEAATEATVEAALDAAELFWDKTETYLETEGCFQILYEIEI